MRRALPCLLSLLLTCGQALAQGAGGTLPPQAASASPAPSGPSAPKDRGDSLGLLQPDTDLIDVPTASVLDYGGYSTRTRFFSNGGVMEWLSFGVFQRLNIGASLNVDKLLGTSTPVQVTRPDLQVKFRFYDGDPVIPAFAIGFDGQGYLYNRRELRYNQRQRGLYLAGSQEVGIPGLEAHAGMNISDFNSNAIFGVMAGSYNVQDKALLMTEWDNINNVVDSRFNVGVRLYVTQAFHLDFAVRGLGQGGDFSNGVSRGAERVAMFKYTGNF